MVEAKYELVRQGPTCGARRMSPSKKVRYVLVLEYACAAGCEVLRLLLNANIGIRSNYVARKGHQTVHSIGDLFYRRWAETCSERGRCKRNWKGGPEIAKLSNGWSIPPSHKSARERAAEHQKRLLEWQTEAHMERWRIERVESG